MLVLAVVTGAPQLSWSGEPSEIARETLNDYYGFSAANVRAGHNDDRLTAAVSVGGK